MAMSINRPVVVDPTAMLRMSSPGKKPIVALFKKVRYLFTKHFINIVFRMVIAVGGISWCKAKLVVIIFSAIFRSLILIL